VAFLTKVWHNPGAMNKSTIYTIQSKTDDFPDILRHIPDPPQKLYIRCKRWTAIAEQSTVAVVGSRKATTYGRTVTSDLVRTLVRNNITVVSGLAYGIDAVAHRAALDNGGTTIAVLAGGLDSIYPGTHRSLAEQIIEQGGALISEYPSGTPHYKFNFIARNRLVSGLSQAVLITEAAEKSGTLHTARFALEQGRDVLVVPGNITSPNSVGTNRLMESGAIPILSSNSLLLALGLQNAGPQATITGSSPEEQAIIDLIIAGETDGAVLLTRSGLETRSFNQALTMLQISGKIRALGANQWSL
jgi:DNA processing protein